jgi:hypothetical protein
MSESTRQNGQWQEKTEELGEEPVLMLLSMLQIQLGLLCVCDQASSIKAQKHILGDTKRNDMMR